MRIEGISSVGHTTTPNADQWGQAGDVAWVLDGATQPVTVHCCDMSPDKFVELMDAALRSLATFPYRDLGDLLREALLVTIGEHAARHPRAALPPGPAATVAMIRLRSGSFEWAVLGDAGIVIGSPPRLISDSRLANIAVWERTAYRRRRGSPNARIALYRAELAARNRPGGYWVMANDPQAPSHALRGISPTTGGAILLSDGVHRHIGRKRLWRDPGDFVNAVRSQKLDALISMIRRHEQATGVGSDDATLATVEAMERPALSF